MKRLAVIAISLLTAFTGMTPAQAFPTAAIATVASQDEVQPVQFRRHHDRGYDRHHYRRYDRRYDRHGRHHRHGNAGAIIGGLAAGAIIGGAIASQSRNSCAQRYRSYRASDNTYQPSSGPRRVCR